MVVLMAVETHEFLRIAHPRVQDLPATDSFTRKRPSSVIGEKCGLVREGSHVEAGDIIVSLYDFDKDKELETVSGALEQKRAELAQLQAGPRTEEIEQGNIRRNVQLQNQLEQALTTRRTELRLAEIELRKTSDLFEQELGARVDMEKAQAAAEVHRSAVAEAEASVQILAEQNDREEDLKTQELAQAESALKLLRAGSRPEEIQQRVAELDMLVARKDILDDEKEKWTIKAQISGTVTTPFVEKILNRHLAAGDEVCRIVDMDPVRAEMFVPEKEMGEVEPGMPVHLKARSFPTDEFVGEINFIAPVAEMVENERVVKIRTELANADGKLKPEMTGVAKIHAGRRRVIELMTRRIIRWFRTEFWHLLP